MVSDEMVRKKWSAKKWSAKEMVSDALLYLWSVWGFSSNISAALFFLCLQRFWSCRQCEHAFSWRIDNLLFAIDIELIIQVNCIFFSDTDTLRVHEDDVSNDVWIFETLDDVWILKKCAKCCRVRFRMVVTCHGWHNRKPRTNSVRSGIVWSCTVRSGIVSEVTVISNHVGSDNVKNDHEWSDKCHNVRSDNVQSDKERFEDGLSRKWCATKMSYSPGILNVAIATQSWSIRFQVKEFFG